VVSATLHFPLARAAAGRVSAALQAAAQRTSWARCIRSAAAIGLVAAVAAVSARCPGQSVPVVSPPHKAVYTLNSQVNGIAFRPRSTELAVALSGAKDGGKVFVCRSWLTKQVRDITLDTMPSPCFAVVYSGDGSRLAWCSWTAGKRLRVTGGAGGMHSIDCGKTDLTALAFTSAGSILAGVATDGVVREWDVNTRRLVRQSRPAGGRGIAIAFSPDGRYVAAAFRNGATLLWRVDALDKPAAIVEARGVQVRCLAFSPDSRRLATAGSDDTVTLWASDNGQKIATLEKQHLDPVDCLAFSPDGRYLASGDRSGRVLFWSMATLQPLSAFFPHRQPIYGLAISSDGEWLASGSQDRSVRFYATRDLGYRLGRVRVAASDPTTGITVDGAAATRAASAPLVLSPGPHTIVATAEDGSNTKTYSLDVAPDSDTTLVVDVKSAFGKLYVAAGQPVDVLLSGEGGTYAEPANKTIERLRPGTYTVLVTPRDSKYTGDSRTVEVRAGATARLDAAIALAYGDPSPPTDRNRLLQTRVNPRDGAEMVWIPPDAVTLGSSSGDRDARPPHKADLGGYWLYRKPVTVAQYRMFCEATRGTAHEHRMPRAPKWGWIDDHPMVMVTWQDAVDYGHWAFGDDRRTWLPTEAQYERAMQGPDADTFPWGGKFVADAVVASVRPIRSKGTAQAGSRPPNGFGLLDIGGNVWEWCADWYDSGYYRDAPRVAPAGPDEGRLRAVRGGAWDTSNAKMFRTDFRGKADPESRSANTGFRCAAG
jgi:formylglycine-generating enzyme